MLPSTLEVYRAALRADPTVTAAERARLLARAKDKEAPVPIMTASGPRLLRRREVAERLSRSCRFVDRLAKDGTIRRIVLPGRTRATGFLLADIERLLAGIVS